MEMIATIAIQIHGFSHSDVEDGGAGAGAGAEDGGSVGAVSLSFISTLSTV